MDLYGARQHDDQAHMEAGTESRYASRSMTAPNLRLFARMRARLSYHNPTVRRSRNMDGLFWPWGLVGYLAVLRRAGDAQRASPRELGCRDTVGGWLPPGRWASADC